MGSITLFALPASSRALGAFSSLLGGLIGEGGVQLPAGSLPDPPSDLPAESGNSISGKSKGKDLKSGDKNNGALKKDELKQKTALVQTAPEPAAVLSQPLVLLDALTWAPHRASISEISPGAVAGAAPDAARAGGPGANPETAPDATPWDSRGAAQIPGGSELVPSGRVAFALRLTPANGEPQHMPGSSIPGSPADFGRDLRVAPALEAQPALANPALANPALANQAPASLVQSRQEWRGNDNPGPGEAEAPVATTATRSSGVSPAPDAVTENHTSQVLAASATADSSAGAWGHLQSRSEIGERVGRPFSSSGPVSVEAANSSLEARSAATHGNVDNHGAALHAGAPVVESNNTAARTGNGERELTAANDQSSPSHSRPSTAASDSIGSDSLGEAGIHPQGENSQTSSRDAREPSRILTSMRAAGLPIATARPMFVALFSRARRSPIRNGSARNPTMLARR